MPKTADSYDIRTTISIKPENNLDKRSTNPTISLDAIKIEVESPLTDDSRGMEGFFNRLLTLDSD
jgi:hypothetical protein